jgi:hypothetical protein
MQQVMFYGLSITYFPLQKNPRGLLFVQKIAK